MTYQPYLIANFATGLENRLQPWLLPDDAQQQLLDGYVYRGVMSKREGYIYYATGEENDVPYCESRIVDRITTQQARDDLGVVVAGNGTVGPYTFVLRSVPSPAVNNPIRRGTVTINGDGQVATDTGFGNFQGANGTIDYNTGEVTITFLVAVAGGGLIYATYDYHPGLPVMGIMNFVSQTNVKTLIVADTKRLNIYNTTNNRLNYLGATMAITGITSANPGEVTTAAAHNWLTGDKVFITSVQGMIEVNNQEYTITKTAADKFTIGVDTGPYGAYTAGGFAELIYSGSDSDFWSWVNYPDKDGNARLLYTNNVNQIGYYAPNQTVPVGDYINYPTFATTQFHMLTSDGVPAPVTTITCLQLFVNKDRLLMLRTTENGVVRPQRIRISGTGANSDNFETSATGAGFIDIPDGTWIQGATFNRDDLIIFTEASTWVLKYTGNDTTPFVIQKIDESRGCQAPFSAFTYLNRSSAASPRGLIRSDGYKVERQDEEIPDFTFKTISGDQFVKCFSGVVDNDRDHYLIYTPAQEVRSQRILVTNYDEDNFNIYRLPLSCMGVFVEAQDITWDELYKFPNWASFAAAYNNWNSFGFNRGAPISIGGGHRGEIWKLNNVESEDNPVRIYDITVVDEQTLEITTDWNNYSLNLSNPQDPEMGADTIHFTAVVGMPEINEKQYKITEVINNYTFRVDVMDSSKFSEYDSGGRCQRVIPFTAIMKKFNPFVQSDKKVRCGWLYMYVDTSDTRLTRNVAISDASNTDPCVITTFLNHNFQTGDQISFFGMVGMTELNGNTYLITVLTPTSFSLNGVDATGFGVYEPGGYATVPVPCKLDIDIIVNDVPENTQLVSNARVPYQGNCTNLTLEDGTKKWYKVFINQTGKFIQFKINSLQAGATINIQAMMPGFAPVGRLI